MIINVCYRNTQTKLINLNWYSTLIHAQTCLIDILYSIELVYLQQYGILCIEIIIKLPLIINIITLVYTFFFTTDFTSNSSDVSTIGKPLETKSVSSRTDESIDALGISDTFSSIDKNYDRTSTNAHGVVVITSGADDYTSTEGSDSTDMIASADDQATIDAPPSSPTTVSTLIAEVKTTSPTHIARDCSDILDQGYTENYGVYRVQPSNDSESFEVVCDLETKGTEWIIFQRRFDGSEDFHLPWEDTRMDLVISLVNTGWVLKIYIG